MIAKMLGLLLLAGALCAGEGGTTLEEVKGPKPWNNLKLNNAPGTFRFAVVTDRTGGHRDFIFETAVDKLNLLQPEFVMSVGDFIEGYTTDQAELDRQWDEFNGFISRLKMPFFYVPGNHDVQNPTQLKDYRRRFGKDFYHFVYRETLFLCLNSDDPYPAKISPEQVAYVAKALEENKKVRWTLIFIHRPMWAGGDEHSSGNGPSNNGWGKVESLLKGRAYTVFAGHHHQYTHRVRNDRRYITLATTGGGSDLRGPAFGQFDQVAWVTMQDSGPMVANLILEGIWDETVATEGSLKMMDLLTNAVPAQATPLYTEDEVLSQAKLKLRCTNDADKPLNVLIEFPEYAPLRPAELRQAKVVPPNSVVFFDLELKGLGDLKSENLGDLPFDWTLSYDSKLNPPLKASGTSHLYIEHPLPLPARKAPVKVDGKLSEWASLPQRCDNSRPPQRKGGQWTGPEDASFRFAVEHDDKNLYVAVQVTDDLYVSNSRDGDNAYNQDGIWITVEGEPDLSLGKKDEKKKGPVWSTMLLPGNFDVAKAQGWGVEGVQTACQLNKQGYAAEMAIPWAALPERLKNPKQPLRVNLSCYDFDKNDLQRGGVYLAWRTEPKNANYFPFAGLFHLRP